MVERTYPEAAANLLNFGDSGIFIIAGRSEKVAREEKDGDEVAEGLVNGEGWSPPDMDIDKGACAPAAATPEGTESPKEGRAGGLFLAKESARRMGEHKRVNNVEVDACYNRRGGYG